MNSGKKENEHPDAVAGDERVEPEKMHMFDKPKNVNKLLGVFLFICWFLFLLDLLFFRYSKHLSFPGGEFDAESMFGFYGAFGFVACIMLVLTAKQMRKFLIRSEDYYDE